MNTLRLPIVSFLIIIVILGLQVLAQSDFLNIPTLALVYDSHSIDRFIAFSFLNENFLQAGIISAFLLVFGLLIENNSNGLTILILFLLGSIVGGLFWHYDATNTTLPLIGACSAITAITIFLLFTNFTNPVTRIALLVLWFASQFFFVDSKNFTISTWQLQAAGVVTGFFAAVYIRFSDYSLLKETQKFKVRESMKLTGVRHQNIENIELSNLQSSSKQTFKQKSVPIEKQGDHQQLKMDNDGKLVVENRPADKPFNESVRKSADTISTVGQLINSGQLLQAADILIGNEVLCAEADILSILKLAKTMMKRPAELAKAIILLETTIRSHPDDQRLPVLILELARSYIKYLNQPEYARQWCNYIMERWPDSDAKKQAMIILQSKLNT